MKVGIYGGTFNPIHAGHVEAARFAATYLKLDILYLIPAGLPPHKVLAEDTPDARHRLHMTKLAAGAIGDNVTVLDIELNRTGKSYTADTLRELQARHHGDELFLLLGTDMFLTIQKWYQAEEIMRRCTLCAFGRSEADTEELFAVQRAYLAETFHANIITIVLPKIVEISSTQLRSALKAGRGREFLCDAVYGYVLREKLYGTACDLTHLSLDDLRCVALSMLAPSRFAHVLGTEETAAHLAVRWGVEEETARRAALLHDCTKILNREQQLALCRQYHIEPDAEQRQEEALLHALTGAAVAQHVFGMSREIVDAIRYHTTGKAAMTPLEQIIYLADYIEPTRTLRGLDTIRRLAEENLEQACLLSLTRSVEHLQEKGCVVHPDSVCARDYLKGQLS